MSCCNEQHSISISSVNYFVVYCTQRKGDERKKSKIKIILEPTVNKIRTVGFQCSMVNFTILFECYTGIAQQRNNSNNNNKKQ